MSMIKKNSLPTSKVKMTSAEKCQSKIGYMSSLAWKYPVGIYSRSAPVGNLKEIHLKQVCIVTVCRNALSDLKLTVASVKAQIYPNIYYIVIDGASSDGTQSYLENSSDTIDDWVSESDQGIYDAMNKGIDRCPPDSWVLFLNAGDEMASNDVLQRLSSCFSPSIDFIFGDVSIRNFDYTRVHRTHPNESIRMPSCHQGTLVRSDLLKALRFDIGYKVGADMDFYLRATKDAKRVAFYDGVISKIAPFGFSEQNESILQKDYYESIKIHFGILKACIWLLKRKLSKSVIVSRILDKVKSEYFA
jgi:glycosyltransferase involved in cell wall biosynthesis